MARYQRSDRVGAGRVVARNTLEESNVSKVSPLNIVVVTASAFLLVLASPSDGRAQGFISPFIGFNFGGDSGCPEITGCEDKNLNLGVAFGAMGSIFGFEEEFGYAKDFLGTAPGFSSNVLTLMSNVMLVPKLGPVRPYVLAGVGLIKTHAELTSANLLTTDNNQFGWNVGGGLMGFFGEHVGLRGDIRYFHAFQDLSVLGVTLGNQKLDFGRASVGLVFKF
jgi:opacity protein-like surface antigen